jgi:cyclophilin family peptidyl-prolyl cis-trans isomerase
MAAEQNSSAGTDGEQFNQVFTEWKATLTGLADLRARYRGGDAAERAAIQAEWQDRMQAAAATLEQLVAAARQSYARSPTADPRAMDVLGGTLAEWNRRDECEKAADLGKFLVRHGCKDAQVLEMAGIAAFAVADWDAAAAYLQAAAANRPQVKEGQKLTARGQSALSQALEYKAAWAHETKLRQAEAKANDLPRVLLETSQGDILLELFENEAPNTVANFLTLVEKGFYNGLVFHRVLPGFMAQGGDPRGDGTGGPGYTIPGEFGKPEHRLHFRGSLGMARAGGPDSAGSQFYLMFAPRKSLDGQYTVFGRMLAGCDVLARLQRIDPEQRSRVAPDRIIEARVLRKRPHAYVVKKTG